MENKDLNNEEVVIKEEIIIEETNDEILENTNLDANVIEEMLKEEIQEESKAIKFIKRILASVTDQIITIAISLLLIVIFDLILKVAGFYIAQRQPIFLMIYVIINILYYPICESTKLKNTIGKKVILK